jgi:hypothetical protein
VLLVRRLSLGRIRAGVAPASVALLLESRLREYSANAVPAQDPAAATALAVYFRDEVEPYVSLALRVATERSTTEWFWPLAVRGWKRGMARDNALRALLAGASQTSAAWSGVMLLICALLDENALAPLLSSLRHQDGPALLAMFGWSGGSANVTRYSPTRSDAYAEIAIPANWCSLAVPWFRSWGQNDARSLWLAAVLIGLSRQDRSAAASGSRLAVQQGRALIDSLVAEPVAEGANPSVSVDRSQRAPSAGRAQVFPGNITNGDQLIDSLVTDKQGAGSLLSRRERVFREDIGSGDQSIRSSADVVDRRLPNPSVPGSLINGVSAQPDTYRNHEFPTPPGVHAPEKEAALTRFGGLFFLVRALERIGLPTWLELNPALAAMSFPALLLRAIARRVGAPNGDAVIAALGCEEKETTTEVNDLMKIWTRALRRWCRRRVRIGLDSLICRRAQIAFTKTHIDLIFRVTDADIRVRKAGLDIDPGWTPWLGRVIHFHYLTENEWNA